MPRRRDDMMSGETYASGLLVVIHIEVVKTRYSGDPQVGLRPMSRIASVPV